MAARVGFASFAVAIATTATLAAAEDGCGKFAWPLARERIWFADVDATTIASNSVLERIPRGAFIVKLLPQARVTYALPPERRTGEQRFGGTLSIGGPEQPGIYQVTLSDNAWIDIVQDGRNARSIGNTGRSDCPGLRKSVRFELSRSSFILQIAGAPSDTITTAILAAE
jgi:hypothetical protein